MAETLRIAPGVVIPESEIELTAVRAQGAGGQNVNKVSSAIHLRFDIGASSLPPHCKERLLALRDRRISTDGVVIIKAQRFRSQERNRDDALERLATLVRRATAARRPRRPTAPGPGARERRLKEKQERGRLKRMRRSDPLKEQW